FMATAVRSQSNDEVVTTSVLWPKRSFDLWWAEARRRISPEVLPAPGTYSIAAPSAGPCVNDTWAETVDEPAARYLHTAVWTGSEMIVWGGLNGGNTPNWLQSGGRYDPATDSWTPTSTGANVPAARYGHSAVWTGTQMIV